VFRYFRLGHFVFAVFALWVVLGAVHPQILDKYTFGGASFTGRLLVWLVMASMSVFAGKFALKEFRDDLRFAKGECQALDEIFVQLEENESIRIAVTGENLCQLRLKCRRVASELASLEYVIRDENNVVLAQDIITCDHAVGPFEVNVDRVGPWALTITIRLTEHSAGYRGILTGKAFGVAASKCRLGKPNI
jgi:hypothetical protein